MNDKAKALMRVQTAGFALYEAILFLDTHPDDREALDYYHKAHKRYDDAESAYVSRFGPLNAAQVESRERWTWNDGCMPWEGECNVEI